MNNHHEPLRSTNDGHRPDDVVVTGLGFVTPIGIGTEIFWKRLVAGESGATRITRFDPSEYPVQIAFEVKDFDASAFMDPRQIARTDRFTQYGIAAAKMAWEDARADDVLAITRRVGVMTGTALGGVETAEREQATLADKGPKHIGPLAGLQILPNAAGAFIAMEYGLTGPSYTIASACATGTSLIGEALWAIKSGIVDAVVTSAFDSAITPIWISSLARLGALSRRNDDPVGASRPFDADRDGFVFGEGAGAMILERRDVAERRGGHILAEIVGYGATTDAYHIAQPHPEGTGVIEAMRLALEMANADPADVDYINAHGTGTPANDKTETIAIKGALGNEAKKTMISATKSQIGHLMGAAGMVEAGVAILAMDRGVVPGTLNLKREDPECDLDYVPERFRKAQVDLALSNSFGLGGHNATVAIRRPT